MVTDLLVTIREMSLANMVNLEMLLEGVVSREKSLTGVASCEMSGGCGEL
jgi:hypothetical protein